MASLTFSDAAFGSLGITVSEVVDLADIASQLNDALGMTLFFDSLDLSRVTVDGLAAIGNGAGDGERVEVGDFSPFTGAAVDISGFDTLAVSEETIAANGLRYQIFDNELFAADTEVGLTHDGSPLVFDFSATGDAPLEVEVFYEVAPTRPPDAFYDYQVIGNAGDNIFTNNSAGQLNEGLPEYLFAADGNDIIYGGVGDEDMFGGTGHDVLFGSDGSDIVEGESGDDALFGGIGADLLFGSEGKDVLFGGATTVAEIAGTQQLLGGAGNDALYASQRFEGLFGEAGNDRFYVVENYDIGTGLFTDDGMGNLTEETVNTGANIASADAAIRIEDFTAGEDLLVFALPDGELFDDGGNPTVSLTNNDSELSYFHSPTETGHVVIDPAVAIDIGSVVIRAQQSGGFDNRQYLGNSYSFNGTNGDISFEVAYGDASESGSIIDNELAIDNFANLQLTPTGESNTAAGQDKFDFTGFNLGELDETAIEDILFTTLDYGGEFTVNTQGPNDPAIENFFFDSDANVDRAVHVEQAYGSPDTIRLAVYVDANFDGAYAPGDDLAFVVDTLQDGNGDLYTISDPLLTKTDLYNDPAADGSGTGIFIFNEEQYDLWYNDVAPPEPIV